MLRGLLPTLLPSLCSELGLTHFRWLSPPIEHPESLKMKHFWVFFFNLCEFIANEQSCWKGPRLFNVISDCFIKQTAAPPFAAVNLKSKRGGTPGLVVLTNAGLLIYCKSRPYLSLLQFRGFPQILKPNPGNTGIQFCFNPWAIFFLSDSKSTVYLLIDCAILQIFSQYWQSQSALQVGTWVPA